MKVYHKLRRRFIRTVTQLLRRLSVFSQFERRIILAVESEIHLIPPTLIRPNLGFPQFRQ